MLKKRIVIVLFLVLPCFVYADYSLDSNSDGKLDVWVEELAQDGYIISTDKNHDGNIDSKISLDEHELLVLEETDYNEDGIMDNFYYYDSGFIVRQEVDSNYDQKVDVWVYITNEGKSISKYEKDLDFDGVVDKIKEFEVYEEDGK